jgi:hypothetical protein
MAAYNTASSHSPSMWLLNAMKNGDLKTKLFAKEQSYKSMMKILGY